MITLLLPVRATYMYGVVLHAHPVRGESHNRRNTTGEVATTVSLVQWFLTVFIYLTPLSNEITRFTPNTLNGAHLLKI